MEDNSPGNLIQEISFVRKANPVDAIYERDQDAELWQDMGGRYIWLTGDEALKRRKAQIAALGRQQLNFWISTTTQDLIVGTWWEPAQTVLYGRGWTLDEALEHLRRAIGELTVQQAREQQQPKQP